VSDHADGAECGERAAHLVTQPERQIVTPWSGWGDDNTLAKMAWVGSQEIGASAARRAKHNNTLLAPAQCGQQLAEKTACVRRAHDVVVLNKK
jgi:hypothetical protein